MANMWSRADAQAEINRAAKKPVATYKKLCTELEEAVREILRVGEVSGFKADAQIGLGHLKLAVNGLLKHIPEIKLTPPAPTKPERSNFPGVNLDEGSVRRLVVSFVISNGLYRIMEDPTNTFLPGSFHTLGELQTWERNHAPSEIRTL